MNLPYYTVSDNSNTHNKIIASKKHTRGGFGLYQKHAETCATCFAPIVLYCIMLMEHVQLGKRSGKYMENVKNLTTRFLEVF